MALGALRPGLVYCPGDWVLQLASMNDFHFSQQRLSGGPAIQPPDGQRGPIGSMCELAKGNRYRRPYSAFLPIGLSVPMIPRPPDRRQMLRRRDCSPTAAQRIAGECSLALLNRPFLGTVVA